MAADHLVELRGEILRDDMAILDAVVQATPGASRMSLVREIISDWCDQKAHEASLIQRVRRGNGNAPEVDRKRTGNGGEA